MDNGPFGKYVNTDIVRKWGVHKKYVGSCDEYFGLHCLGFISKSNFIVNIIYS